MKTTKKAKNGEIEIIFKVLSEYSKTDFERPVPLGLKIVRSLKGIAQALEPYEIERERIVKKYAGDNGEVKKEDNTEKFEECKGKVEELLNVVVDVDIETLAMDEIKTMNAPMKYMIGFAFLMGDEKKSPN